MVPREQVEKVLHADSVEKAKRVLKAQSGVRVLGTISFLESAFPLPILTDVFLIAAILIDRTNAKKIVVVSAAASVIGGIVAYFSASYFFEFLLTLLSPEMVVEFDQLVASNTYSAFMLSLVGAVTPVPYTFAAWAVAILEGSLFAFIAASIIGRGFRYALVGYCVYRFGPVAQVYLRRYLTIVTVLMVGLLLYLFLHM